MKYEVGDDIIVLHSNEEGKVIEIVNEKMVMIEIRGVKFPAYMDQIDFPYFYRFSKKKIVEESKPSRVFLDNVPKEKPKPIQEKVSEGVLFILIPIFSLDDFNDEIVTSLKIRLVNKTPSYFKFKYDQTFLKEITFSIENEIPPFHDFYLHDIPFEKINDSPNLSVEFSLKNPDKSKADSFATSLKLKPKQVFQRIEEMKLKNEPTISYHLFDEFPIKEISNSVNTSTVLGQLLHQKLNKNLESPRSIVDLHIEKLTDDWKSMSNFEILTKQLEEFEKWFYVSIAHHQSSMIVIHGIGTGKLKDEIHSLLKSKKEVNYFINQYDPRFGYGATEIFFKN